MSFPSNPSNGQTAFINGITYSYSTSTISWTRQLTANTSTSVYTSFVSILNSTASTGTSTGALIVNGGAGIGGTVNAGNVTVASALTMGSWSNSTRPSNATNGTIGYNSDLSGIEVYMGSNWYTMIQSTYTVSYLIVAGGGGGGRRLGAGGGAGGLLSGTTTLSSGVSYTITVGSGGAGATSDSSVGSTGTNSTAVGLTAYGGGGGGSFGALPTSGGSGGGGTDGETIATTGAAGITGQGYAGGSGVYSVGIYLGGGGGGSGGIGGNAVNTVSGGNGGIGTSVNIITTTIATSLGIGQVSGGNVYFAGGGGGGYWSGATSGTAGAGGLGGGATGFYGVGGNSNVTPSASAYTGGGGGGGGWNGSSSGINGGSGGSGIVIISYQSTNQRGSGGTVTNYTVGLNTWWVHAFTITGSNTYTA